MRGNKHNGQHREKHTIADRTQIVVSITIHLRKAYVQQLIIFCCNDKDDEGTYMYRHVFRNDSYQCERCTFASKMIMTIWLDIAYRMQLRVDRY